MSEFKNYILINIFFSFPEIIVILLLGLSLCNIKIDIKKVLLVAVLQSIVALLVRYGNLYFGIHTIVQTMTTCILTAIIFNMKLYKAIIPVLLGVLIDGVVASVNYPVIRRFYEVDFFLLNKKVVPTIITGAPILMIMITLILLVRKAKFTLCNLDEEVENLGK